MIRKGARFDYVISFSSILNVVESPNGEQTSGSAYPEVVSDIISLYHTLLTSSRRTIDMPALSEVSSCANANFMSNLICSGSFVQNCEHLR
jgi:hypothetical protein